VDEGTHCYALMITSYIISAKLEHYCAQLTLLVMLASTAYMISAKLEHITPSWFILL
jgi:hypothetical protein